MKSEWVINWTTLVQPPVWVLILIKKTGSSSTSNVQGVDDQVDIESWNLPRYLSGLPLAALANVNMSKFQESTCWK